MSEPLKANPVYFHDCPALGANTRIMQATRLNSDNTVVLYRQYKCVFCSETAGEIEYAAGITPRPEGGYWVDMSKAEKVI